MNIRNIRCATGALFLFALALPGLPGCGGGGSSGRIVFTLQSVDPATSNDLNGGDAVTITGANFSRFVGFTVHFGGNLAVNPQVQSDNELTVTTPGQANPGSVIIEVTGVNDDGELVTRQLFDAYTYVGAPVNPNPQTITPTTFTATGAESFTIGGTSLGTPGGTVQVTFAGVGTVTAQVSNDATLAVGNAPIATLTGPVNLIAVTIGSGAGMGTVPTQVAYAYTAPQSLLVRFQAQGGASRPVRMADGFAVMCAAGPDAAWTTADDEVYILQMGPGPAPLFVPVRRTNQAAVGWLDRRNSVPVVLDGNTICVYSTGPDGVPDPVGAAVGDDRVVQITAAQTTPVVTDHPTPFLNTAPLARISSSAVGFTTAGVDKIRGTADDALIVYRFNGTTLGLVPIFANVGPVDVTAGRPNASLPFSADGDVVYVLTAGPDGLPYTQDDTLYRATISTAQLAGPVAMRWLAARPVALPGNLAAAPAFGANGVQGGGDDELLVASTIGGPFGVASFPTGQPVDGAAFAPSARLGASDLAVTVVGPDLLPRTGDERILVYTDVATGTLTSFPAPGTSILATLGSGDLMTFSPGLDFIAGNVDDTVIRLDATALTVRNFLAVPNWPGGFVPLTDTTRVFAIADPDGTPGSGDETLVVHQARSLGNATDAVALALASVGAPVGAPATVFEPFVPVGPGWGVIQSPGPNRVYGGNDDRIIFAHYEALSGLGAAGPETPAPRPRPGSSAPARAPRTCRSPGPE